ncbi:MAG: 4Fe-4S binding protein [Mycoplasmataceae bacterium]|nr:4Fe-4S binding protein [Mycoplasmataceae bacterium]
MPNKKITIIEERCKGCSVCTQFCPLHLLSVSKTKINPAGYNVISVSDINKCIGCGMCSLMCPDRALKLKENQ